MGKRREPEPIDFRPSKRQRDFLSVAADCYAEGDILVANWLCASMEKMSRKVKKREWENWLQEPGFWDWWEDELPFLSELTRTDYLALDRVFWEGVGKGMRKGEGWAYGWYSKAREARALADVAAGGINIEDYLNEQRASAWALPEEQEE